MSKSKATEGTQVSMESGKTSWVLLFTHFHIKRLLLPSNLFLEAKALWRVISEREKGSSKEAGSAESRVNPVNLDSSQKSWYHLSNKALWKQCTEINIPAVFQGFPGTWLLPPRTKNNLKSPQKKNKVVLHWFTAAWSLWVFQARAVCHSSHCPSLPYFEKIAELLSLPEKWWVRWWRRTEEFTAAVSYKTWHPQPEGTWV